MKFAIDSKAESIAALEREADLPQRLSHPNIIRFLGKGFFHVGDRLLQGLCTELAMQGDARTYILVWEKAELIQAMVRAWLERAAYISITFLVSGLFEDAAILVKVL